MSIKNAIRIIQRMDIRENLLIEKYQHDSIAKDELLKLKKNLHELAAYLENIDQLKPNYNTNELESYLNAIMLHMDLLKEKLDKKDFLYLDHGIRVLKTMLKFHPTKYSFLAFITAWFMELLYFI